MTFTYRDSRHYIRISDARNSTMMKACAISNHARTLLGSRSQLHGELPGHAGCAVSEKAPHSPASTNIKRSGLPKSGAAAAVTGRASLPSKAIPPM